MIIKSISPVLISLSLLSVSSYAATTAYVDFSASASAPDAPAGGNYWTTVGDNDSVSLLDGATGNDTGWDIQVSTPDTAVGFGGTGIDGNGADAPFDQEFATIDGIFSNRETGVATIFFSGLEADTLYKFSTYSDRASLWRKALISTTTGAGGPTDLITVKDTVQEFSITSDASGEIAFTFARKAIEGDTSGNGVLNALTITAVPEPSSLTLLGLGGLALILRRKK